jgi:starch phosphorylase
MYAYEKITVVPKLPERINKLNELAYNLWWSWNTHAVSVFESIDQELWIECEENPVRFLQQVSSKKLEAAADNHEYLLIYDNIINQFNTYMNADDTWFIRNFPDKKDNIIAYFSAEYGLHETLPMYSGGLGILSGDHCKSASDLGLPFVAVGLLYKQGYFRQQLNQEGWQEAKFIKQNISELPIQATKDQNGNDVIISTDFPGRTVHAKVWEIHVGRIKIYMMDTDIPENNFDDRHITSILYGGEQEMRISQEIILGIGGIKMLDALGIKPSVYHLNEGHSAFCTLEIMRKLIQYEGLSFHNAREVVAASTVFTTHTPVPAGSDRFPLYLMDKYFSNVWTSLGINRHQFMEMGSSTHPDSRDVFNMTILALKTAGQRNGVSKLHGMVSRNIFNHVWERIPEEEVPIGSITNGIHTATWLNPSLKDLYGKYLGQNWEENIHDTKMWRNIDNIPDEALWDAHMANKQKMIDFIRDRVKTQKIRNGEAPEEIESIDKMLDPNALTIGFARRFATYKRATLIFRNLSRLQRILNNPAMPVQIIFAGKAHPADYPGQELIKHIHDLAHQEGFKGKVFLVENYDMKLARHLLSGVDVWLNNPRRPLEASGTSGQKAALNGIINFSVLDGWWVEGYNGHNGWAIGDETYYSNTEQQDNVDAQSLYATLEEQIVPLYYERNEKGIPVNWVRTMKASIKTCAPVFSTARMVQDYVKDYYVTAMRRKDEITKNHYALAQELSQWKSHVSNEWSQVRIIPDRKLNYYSDQKIFAGRPVELSTIVYLGNINPNNARVEVYYGKIGQDGMIEQPEIAAMELQGQGEGNNYHYKGTIHLDTGGEYGYTFRVLPYHSGLINEYDLGLIKWVETSEYNIQ